MKQKLTTPASASIKLFPHFKPYGGHETNAALAANHRPLGTPPIMGLRHLPQ